MSGFRIPRPEALRMSPELAKSLADFTRAANEAGNVIGARAARVMGDLVVGLEQAKRDRRRTQRSPAQPTPRSD